MRSCSTWFVITNLAVTLYCFLQIVGLATNNTPFRAVADFDNPTGVATFLCLTFPFSILALGRRWRIMLITLVYLLNSIVLFLIQSRSGLTAITLTLLIGAIIFLKKHKYKNHKIAIVISIVTATIGLLFLSYKKQASTNGRMVIYKTCMNMLADRPSIGYGPGVFDKHYMEYQAKYLETVENEDIRMLSDNISHPLSEYLLIAVNYGIAGVIIVLTILIVSILWVLKIKGPVHTFLLMMLCTIGILSLFSYPFRYPITIVTLLYCGSLVFKKCSNDCIIRYKITSLSFLLAVSIITIVLVIRYYVALVAWNRMIEGFAQDNLEKSSLQHVIKTTADCVFKNNARYLYSRAVTYYNINDYTASLIDAKNSADILSCYDTELLLGSIYNNIGEYTEAQRHYKEASEMCPSRITPLYCLFRLYEQQHDTTLMLEYGGKLLSKPVKISSHDTRLMRLDVKRTLLNINK